MNKTSALFYPIRLAGIMTQQLFTNNSTYDCAFFSPVVSYADPFLQVECGHACLHALCTCVFVFICCECVRQYVFCLFVFLAAALALCKYSLAEWNATDESANRTVSHCQHHGNGDNCTGRCGHEAVPFEVLPLKFFVCFF